MTRAPSPAIGAKVTAHYYTHSGPLEDLSKTYPDLQIVQSDLSNEASVVNMFSTVVDNAGPVQVLVVNHASWVLENVQVAEMALEQWNHTISSNLTSSFLVCREYLKHLKNAQLEAKEKAAIVLIGATAGKYGDTGHADFAASKSAMMYGLTMTLKYEIVKIAPRGRVNSVAPGWVRTPIVDNLLSSNPDLLDAILAKTPLGKIAMPLDVATQIVALSSSTVSGHVTGQVVMVDGGMEGTMLN